MTPGTSTTSWASASARPASRLASRSRSTTRPPAPRDRILAKFVERQPRFGWHRGMLLPGTTMQVSFLKDLATMRNPHSTFSFVSYLHAQDRLVDFINGKSLFPSRIEFHGYLEWVADAPRAPRRLRHRGRRRAPRARRRHRRLLRRRRRRRQRHPRPQHRRRDRPDADAARRHRALRARLAHVRAAAAPRVARRRRAPRRFVVVGAGQSAAEATEHLHDRFAAAEICSVFSRYGYSPADDSPVRQPDLRPGRRRHVLRRRPPTPSGCSSTTTRTRTTRSSTSSSSRSSTAAPTRRRCAAPSGCAGSTSRASPTSTTPATTSSRSSARSPTARRRCCAPTRSSSRRATTPSDATDLLGEVGAYCLRDTDGRLSLRRDYRVETSPLVAGGIYLQGACQESHGLSSSLLSNTAVRAGEILESLLAARADAAAAATPTSR